MIIDAFPYGYGLEIVPDDELPRFVQDNLNDYRKRGMIA